MNIIEQLIDERRTLMIDGAMGTELFARGLTAGDPPELWNLELADKVTEIHRNYINAGSDIILTNSFGGTSFRLKLHNLDGQVFELNKAAAMVAREAADASARQVIVAGSMGPTGELLEPMGEMTPETAADAFAAQAEGLAAGGADILWIETMSSLDDIEAAITGARRVTDLPIAATLSYDTAGRTMMGVTGTEAAARLTSLGVAAVGANCGNNVADTEAAVRDIKAGAGDTPVIVKANAGVPEFKGDALVYSGSAEVMGAHVKRMMAAGIEIIGGCCGTSTNHLMYMRGVIDGAVDAPDIPAPGPSRAEDEEAAERARERSARRSRRRR